LPETGADMAEETTLPFSILNAIPGVSGVEDVTLQSLTEDDVEEIIQEIEEQAESPINPDDIIGPLSEVLEEELADPQQFSEDLAVAVTEVLDDELPDFTEGLFGPLDIEVDDLDGLLGDIGDRLDEIEDQVDTEPDGRLEEIQDSVDSIGEDLPEVDVPTLEDIREVVAEAILDVQPTVDSEGLFTEPVAFIEALIPAGIDRAVDDQVQADLTDALDRIEEEEPGGEAGGVP